MFISSVLFCLLSFSNSFAEFDSNTNKTLEKRLHSIYVSHYTRPVLDSDWFKILESIEVQKHNVQPGDTLWGISKVYFGDGNYWSKLWSVNKAITNPHLIFVGDVIKFHTGSFDSTPTIDIEKVGPDAPPVGDNEDEPAVVTALTNNADEVRERPLQKIPDFFQSAVPVQKEEEAPIIFIPRPKLQFKSEFQLIRDILEQPPEVVGTVNSLGQYRMVTAEGSILLLNSVGDLSEGGTYSVIKQDSGRAESGYPIHIQGIVQVVRKIDGDMYEAKLIKQFEAIEIGDLISTYQVSTVNSDVTSTSAAVEVPIRILTNVNSLWSAGDPIFIQALESTNLNLGDVVKINNKFTDRTEYYVSNGYVKIVSVHPPYATGIVISSREHVRGNSVSAPTYTGWSIW